MRDTLKIGAPRQVESHESVSVLIGASLPGRVRLGEEKSHANGGGNGLVGGGFPAVVVGHRATRFLRQFPVAGSGG